jgi:hypothetical protein
LYVIDKPIGGRNGGTVLGYSLGVIAALGIAYLMYYGIRKRSYHAKVTTLKATLSAHVWIGLSLLYLVPLHSGFSFGLNVHTLAYVLMVIVVLSGLWGVFMYEKLPLQLKSQRGGGTIRVLLEQIKSLSDDISAVSGTSKTSNVERSDAFLKMLEALDFSFVPSLRRSLFKANPRSINKNRSAQFLQQLPRDEQESGLKLIGLVNKKRELVCRVQDEARALTWIRLWLFIHLPISIALCVALFIHIFSVFYYW